MAPKRIVALAALVLTVLAVVRVAATWTTFSHTTDEPAHVLPGIAWLTGGQAVYDDEHPPLGQILFGLDAWLDTSPARGSEDPFYRNDQYLRNLVGMRAGNLPFLVLAIAVVFLWTRRLFDAGTALFAVALVGAVPPLLGHAGLATTDMPVTAMVTAALYALWLWLDEPSPTKAAILGFTVGLGLLSKFSFVLFFGPCAIAFLIARWPLRMRQLGLAAVLALLTVWTGYRFAIGTIHDVRLRIYPTHWIEHQAARYASVPGYDWVRPDLITSYRRFAEETARRTGYSGIDFVDWARSAGYPSPLAERNGFDTMAKAPPLPPRAWSAKLMEPGLRARQWVSMYVPLPAPQYVAGLEFVKSHSRMGHPSFLLGEYRADGWWYYFPVVLFFKTPLAFLILAVVGIGLTIKRYPAIALASPLMLLPLMPSGINIGVRHALPIYPLLAICAASAAMWLWRNRPVVAAVLLGWFFVSTSLAHPDYLAWFNEAAGKHPENIVVDSNLDWGQDLLRLKREVRRSKLAPLHIAYFGAADWKRLGIEGNRLLSDNRCVEGWVAISETERVMGRDSYAWLRSHEPVKRIGRSIRLYEIHNCLTEQSPVSATAP